MNLYAILLLLSPFIIAVVHARLTADDFIRLPSEKLDSAGTRWAVLLAGSNGYWNYRHQSDVCHAYQILKNGGLKDENIVVFMYDDIANNEENPRPGIIINSPDGDDVYHGVPKDYTGEDVTVDNFFAVLLGNKTAVKGGSGKVVNSGPYDHIFIFYSDHGGPGVLGMPTSPYMYANDLIDVLKKKHASGTYKSLVFYLEACESGSIFEGLLPEGLNIYATTASGPNENSWGTYCPGESPSPPQEYGTCLGDLYSVAWMEDCEVHNLQTETVQQQYHLVKERTSNGNVNYGSHVMQYGDLQLSKDELYLYLGTNPANENFTFINSNSLRSSSKTVNQRDADLLHFWHKYQKAPEGSTRKVESMKQFAEAMAHRMHVDSSIKLLGKVLFGIEKGPEVLNEVRPAGQPLVDDWDCLKTFVRTFETHCGSLSQYGMKHMRSIANFCNAGITKEQMVEASSQACPTFPSNSWSSLNNGFSA
ncbi:hypothetical protein L1987_55836 [Smallanthus sonchifolius]|uniref:Uncharacterized protein n=1 Tax=Smallanthus sonchifolius TaxID=185202 RepID=A0ACB9EAR3_9ASTR|nr:hypothetical protein L1987_55836 [Smallanthus sonchifolius]